MTRRKDGAADASSGALPVVEFLAAAAPFGSWLKTNADGETTVTLAVPGSDLAAVVTLHLYRGRTFRVTVAPA